MEGSGGAADSAEGDLFYGAWYRISLDADEYGVSEISTVEEGGGATGSSAGDTSQRAWA